jgi:hypothetical protein
MLDHCESKEVLIKQVELLKKCIEEHKYYLSEKIGVDVGWDFAEQDFLFKYGKGFFIAWRAMYCSLACPFREDCTIGKHYC